MCLADYSFLSWPRDGGCAGGGVGSGLFLVMEGLTNVISEVTIGQNNTSWPPVLAVIMSSTYDLMG